MQKPEFLYGTELVNEYVPAEDVFDFASLDASDVVVELEGLRTALSVSVCIDSLLFRLEERFVYELVDGGDDYCCAAFSDFLECAEFGYRYWPSLHFHSEMSCNCFQGHIGD